MSPQAHPKKGPILLAFAAIYLIWGSTYLGIRVAVESMPPFLMAGFRFLVSGIVLFLWQKLSGQPWPTARQWRENAISGTAMLLGGNALVAWAEQQVPSGLTTLILGASPFLMAFLDWLRPGGTRPVTGIWVGIAVGLAGVALLLGPGVVPEDSRPPAIAVLALFISASCWWIGSLYSKHTRDNAAPIMASSVQMLTACVTMIGTGLLSGEASRVHLSQITGASWAAFAYLIVFGSLIAFPTYVWLLKHSTPARVSTYAYVNPVVAVVLGWAVLGEPLNWRIAGAGAVIIAAVAIITVQKAKLATAR